MTTDTLIQWFEDNLQDGDFEGDDISAIADALITAASRGKNQRQNKTDPFIEKLPEVAPSFYAGLENRARTILKEKIKEAIDLTELQRIDPSRFTKELKLYYGRRQASIEKVESSRSYVRSLGKEGLLRETSITGRRTLSGFANFYNLDEGEALDLLIDRGLTIGPGNKIFEEE